LSADEVTAIVDDPSAPSWSPRRGMLMKGFQVSLDDDRKGLRPPRG
jgi:hypothetical protein